MRWLPLLLLLIAGPAFAQVPPSSLPAATVPLNGVDALPIDQGTGCPSQSQPCTTKSVSSLRLGQPLQQSFSPSSPFQYQQWWNTGMNPVQLNVYSGAGWVPIMQLDTTNNRWSVPGNLLIPSGNVGIGTNGSTTPNWPLTLFENNTTSTQGVTSNTYENGTGTVGTSYRAFAARGTLAAPTAVQSADLLGAFKVSGFWSGKTNGYYEANDERASIEMHAAEAFSTINNAGTYISFLTTPTASGTIAEVARLNENGLLGIGTTAPNFGVTLSKNNPISAGGISQGYTVNSFENNTGTVGTGFRGYAARGPNGTPTAVLTNDPLVTFGGSGFWTGKTSNFWTSVDGKAAITIAAAENFTGSNNTGTYIAFSTTTNATGTPSERMRLQNSGGLSLGTTTDGGANNLLVAGVGLLGATDTGLSRAAAGLVAFGSGAAGNAAGGNKLTYSAYQCSTFALLPAAPAAGYVACVTNSNTNTWGAGIAGGGANNVLAYYNGAAWTVAAK